MDIPTLLSFLSAFHWDVLLVVCLSTACMIGITVWLVCNRNSLFFVSVSWVLFLIFLLFGCWRAANEERVYQKIWEETFLGITRSFVSATEALGHAKITRNTEPDDPIYQGILNVHSAWCRDLPMVAYVFTLRLRENETNKTDWIVSCESDVNQDGIISGPAEQGEGLYEPYDEWFDIYRKGFEGETALDDHVYSKEYGGYFVTAVAPLRDLDGSIEGILGVDFRLTTWNLILNQIRSSSSQLFALMMLLYLGSLCFVAFLQRTVVRIMETNRELVAAKKAADVAAKAKSDFLSNMSHEIRTPMNALLGFTEILTQRIFQNCGPREREESEGILEIINKSSQDLLTIVNDILDFSKIEANLLQVESVPVSIKQVLEDIWQMEMSNVVAKHLDFSVKYKEPIPELILGDPVRLRQILTNLIDNAIKFTENGSITIQCETFAPSQLDSYPVGIDSSHGGSSHGSGKSHHDDPNIARDPDNPYPGSTMLRIDVIDTGIGISSSQIQNLFQPFTQLDNSSTRLYGGTGLGLSIAKRLAQLMDGDITVTSQMHHGSSFSLILHVYLPSEHDIVTTSEKKSMTGGKGSTLQAGLEIRPPISDIQPSIPQDPDMGSSITKSQPLKNARILLVEDMAVNQLVISTQLRDAGAMVEIVGNGELGVEKINRDIDDGLFFDVVLMDMQMPVMDGYEATTLLRQQNYNRPIVAITAHALTGDREKTIEAGCDDYIAKPVDRKVLIETIRKYLK